MVPARRSQEEPLSHETLTIGDRELPIITSTRNERVVRLSRLHRRRDRDEQARFLVEGQHPVAEAVADGRVSTVFVVQERAHDALVLPGIDAVEVVAVADHVLDRLADARAPQGMVAVGAQTLVDAEELVVRNRTSVLLVDANDPGNVGAIIRTADAAGAPAVVLTRGSCDPHAPKAVRAAAGSLTHVDLAWTDDAVALVAAARGAGRRTVALDAAGTLDLLGSGPGVHGDLLVLGSEAHGLPAAILDAVDVVGCIPIRGRAESLNLAATAAIALYAVTAVGDVDPRA